MKSVIVAWYKPGKYTFEQHVPLEFIGKRNLRLRYSNDIDVIFLEGMELLDSVYKKELQRLGFKLIDASVQYQLQKNRYDKLERFGNYESKCFLRWIIIKELYPSEHIIHYDGDIVFNESPQKIGELLSGKTFVLQGCPALTSIADPIWLVQYQSELDRFHEDIEGYSAQAWQERAGWEITKFEKWAGERYRKIITSDQDLISHLIHTGRIIQHDIAAIKEDTKDYILIQNPLLIDEHQNDKIFSYHRTNDIDYINDKRVLIWHMQSDFIFYLSLFLYRKKYTPLNGRLHFEENKHNKVVIFFYKLISRITGYHHRRYIYWYFFKKSDFREVFNHKVWWRPGVF